MELRKDSQKEPVALRSTVEMLPRLAIYAKGLAEAEGYRVPVTPPFEPDYIDICGPGGRGAIAALWFDTVQHAERNQSWVLEVFKPEDMPKMLELADKFHESFKVIVHVEPAPLPGAGLRRGTEAPKIDKDKMSDSELLDYELKHGPTHPDFSFNPDMQTEVVDLSPRAQAEYDRRLIQSRADTDLQMDLNGD